MCSQGMLLHTAMRSSELRSPDIWYLVALISFGSNERFKLRCCRFLDFGRKLLKLFYSAM